MKSKFLTLVATALALAGCGGGGGGNVQEDNSFTPAAPRIDILPQNQSLPANTVQFPPETNSPFLTPVTVRVQRNDGAAIPDGVLVFLRTQDVRTISLAPANANLVFADVTCAQTFGGMAGFLLHSGPQAGTVQLTASVTFPPVPGEIDDDEDGRICTQEVLTPGSQSYFANRNFQVTPGPAPFERIEVVSQRTTLPANTANVTVTPTSPFVSEVNITVRSINGQLVQNGVLNVSINPAIARFSIPNDPTTAEDEFNLLRSSGTVQVIAGRAVLYVHSTGTPGTFTLTLSGVDPVTGAQIQRQVTFTTAGVANGLPSQVRINSDASIVYTRGTNGNNDKPLTVTVTDAAGQPIGDSNNGNVLLEILPVANGSGEVLATQGAADSTVVRVRTVAGVGAATYRSGTRQGIVTIRATADRADNNVDNGIQNGVVSQTSFVVSDGKLFDLELTTPDINAIRINGVDPAAMAEDVDVDGQTITLPPNLDATYALTVSVVATDRQGNPVLPGTPIEFGMIDSPVTGFPEQGAGFFAITGNDGDPQEAGSNFTAPTGRFTTDGGGAGPGDTLLVFGEDSNGNRDLESARIVSRVNGSTSLTIQNRFNRNDDTGNIVNNGPVLPYVIGRNTTGNIGSNVVTRADGVATTRMTYPVSALGRLVAVWARGSGDVVDGSAELVSEVELLRFPGVANARLSVAPSVIPPNRTSTVQICLNDALRSAIAGVFVDFAVQGGSQVTVDGQAGSGEVDRPTDRSGCTTAQVTTTGVVGAGTTITFSVGGLTGVVTVSPANTPVLQAIPSQLGGGGGPVLLRLLDGNGVPIPGVQITGVCTGGAANNGQFVSLQTPPGATNAQGETSAVVAAALNGIGSAGTGSCVFTAANGPSVTVTLTGINVCNVIVSPSPPGCPVTAPTTPTQGTLLVQIDPANPALGFVVGAGINCDGSANADCSQSATGGTSITLTATAVNPATTQFCGFFGGDECSDPPSTVSATNRKTVVIDAGASQTCIARFSTSNCP